MLRVGKEDGKKKIFCFGEHRKKDGYRRKSCGSHPLHRSTMTTTIRALAERTVVVVRGVQPPRNEKYTDLSVTG